MTQSGVASVYHAPMEPEFRPASPEDAEACVAMRGRTRENALSREALNALGITPESWGEQIRSGALPGQVCEVDGSMVGYCFGARDSGEIVVLAVLPEFEQRGIGRQLLQRSTAALAAIGHSRLFLGCSPDPDSRSYGFYRYLGWRSTGTFDQRGDEILELHIERRQRADDTQTDQG